MTTTVRALVAKSIKDTHRAAEASGQKRNLRQFERAGRMNGIADLASDAPKIRVHIDELDAHDHLLGVPNGIVDLKTGELRPADPGLLITKSTAVPYDPSARCPGFRRFVDQITLGNRELQDYLQRLAGYGLTGSTHDQAVFVLLGRGANGKTTLMETLTSVLRDYASHSSLGALLAANQGQPTPEVARLLGVRMVTVTEPDMRLDLGEARLKELTGGERITARDLHKTTFEFAPKFKVFICANEMPNIRGTDEGIWRRIRVIPFDLDLAPSEMDPNLRAKLKQEAPGILRWLVEGAIAAGDRRIEPPASVVAASNKYRHRSDPVRAFVDECCLVGKGRSTVAKVRKAFEDWCTDNGVEPPNATQVGRRIKDLGVNTSRTSKQRYYLLSLRESSGH